MSKSGSEGRAVAPAGLKFDRRSSPRWKADGLGMATFASASGPTRLVRVRMVDAGQHGMSVCAAEPVDVGSTFTLFPDDVRASAAYGRVVRCTLDGGGGYRLGLQRLARQVA